jgi:ribonuclease P protein component
MKESFAFPKQEKLTGETTVNALFLNGRSMIAYPMRIVWSIAPAKKRPSLRVLMSVPKKKLKHAVDRNRVKRLLRESFRLHKRDLSEAVFESNLDLQIAFVWIPNEVLGFDKVERKMMDVLQKLQMQLELERKQQPINTSNDD